MLPQGWRRGCEVSTHVLRRTAVTFAAWRVVHRSASATLAAFAVLHSALTFFIFDAWSPDAVWFLGTGMALLLLAVLNWAHVGLEPCDMPTAPVVRWSNVAFAVFGAGAVMAVPEFQAYAILLVLIVQAVAGWATLAGPRRHDPTH